MRVLGSGVDAGNSKTSYSITLPSNIQNGDVGVVWHHVPGYNITAPAGWSTIINTSFDVFPYTQYVKVWIKSLTVADAGQTFTVPSYSGTNGQIHFVVFSPSVPASSLGVGNVLATSSFQNENQLVYTGIDAEDEDPELILLCGHTRAKASSGSTEFTGTPFNGRTAGTLIPLGTPANARVMNTTFTAWTGTSVVWRFYIQINPSG